MITFLFTHRQRFMMNEKQNRKTIVKRVLTISTKNDFTKKLDSTNIDLNQSSHEIKHIKENHVSSKILENVKRIISKIFNEYRT